MAFNESQYDGPYEVIAVEITINNEILRGVLYYPPKSHKKPYSLIIYFHGFPQLFPLQEIVKEYQFLLDMGYAFLIFNFRGYECSDGHVSLHSQFEDAYHMKILIETLSDKSIFIRENINIIAHDFGAFIALSFCSKYKGINKLLLITPILNLKKHVYNKDFLNTLNYISHFLPGHVKGIKNTKQFIQMTKKELHDKDFQINAFIQDLEVNSIKVIIGENDKITPLSEVNELLGLIKKDSEFVIIEDMDHNFFDDEDIDQKNREIKNFFKL